MINPSEANRECVCLPAEHALPHSTLRPLAQSLLGAAATTSAWCCMLLAREEIQVQNPKCGAYTCLLPPIYSKAKSHRVIHHEEETSELRTVRP